VKKTEWFPARIKPMRHGVYETRTGADEYGDWYQYWDGKNWRATGSTVDRAYSVRAGSASTFSRVEWRGLTEKA
jgi:hypothetical protein